MPFPTFDRSKRQATDAHPMQRRHIAGLVAVGAVVATSAFALPVLAQAGEAPTADASATVPTSGSTSFSMNPASFASTLSPERSTLSVISPHQ